MRTEEMFSELLNLGKNREVCECSLDMASGMMSLLSVHIDQPNVP